jgi:hypothetical protein
MPAEAVPETHPRTSRQVLQGFGSPAVLCLGLVHLGTLGLGQALAPWLALYFAARYELPLGLSAALGSIGLFAGILFRPLGGVLLARRVFGAVALMRMGTILACTGVVLLALPAHRALAAGVGMALFAFGTTLLAGPVLTRAWKTRRTSGTATRKLDVHEYGLPPSARLDPDANLRTALAQLTKAASHVQQTTAPARPVIVMLGFLSQAGDGHPTVVDTDVLTLQRLLEAGGMPVLLPLSPSFFQQEAPPHLPGGEDRFRRLFDEVIWPLFCQMVLQQARGVCLTGRQNRQSPDGSTPRSEEVRGTRHSSKMVDRSLVLLARLVGMPVLSGDKALQKSLQARVSTAEDTPAQGHVFWTPLTTSSTSPMDNDEEARAVCAQFVAACNAYTPLSPDALPSLQAPIYAWLRQRQQAFVRQTVHLQTLSGKEVGVNEPNTRDSASWANMRLSARQQKLRVIRGTVSSPGKRGNASIQTWPEVSGDQFAPVQNW